MTTLPPTTPQPTTSPEDLAVTIAAGFTFHRGLRRVVARATTVDASGVQALQTLDVTQCTAELFGEGGSLGSVTGTADQAGVQFARFEIPDIVPVPSHAYILRISLVRADDIPLGTRDFPMGTT